MPPHSVPSTVRDLIFYYYAKLVIAPSSGEAGNYRFIIDRYKRLRDDEIHMSDYDREIQHLAQQPGRCCFCSRPGSTSPVEVVPRGLGGPVGIHNLVHACAGCAASKGDKHPLRWWVDELGRDKDEFPRIPAGLYLKLCYERHAVEFTLNRRIASAGTSRSCGERPSG